MKKKLFLLIALIATLSFLITGCNNDKKSDDKQEDSEYVEVKNNDDYEVSDEDSDEEIVDETGVSDDEECELEVGDYGFWGRINGEEVFYEQAGTGSKLPEFVLYDMDHGDKVPELDINFKKSELSSGNTIEKIANFDEDIVDHDWKNNHTTIYHHLNYDGSGTMSGSAYQSEWKITITKYDGTILVGTIEGTLRGLGSSPSERTIEGDFLLTRDSSDLEGKRADTWREERYGGGSSTQKNSNQSATSYNSDASKTSDKSTNNDGTCGVCHGSGKCHICDGEGYMECTGDYCNNGVCGSCGGSGKYMDRGTIYTCLVCGGDGKCDICKGTGKKECSICYGKGKCKTCHGKGKIR